MVSNRPAEKTLGMLSTINSAGTGNLIRYVRENHPKENVLRNIQIIKYAASTNMMQCARRFGISHQRVYKIIHTYCHYALEAKRLE